MLGSRRRSVAVATTVLPWPAEGRDEPTWRERVARVDGRGIVRSGLTHMPWLADMKAQAFYAYLRAVRRPFEEDFHALRPYLRDDTLCLDVGANHGQSIDALRMIRRDVRIIAIEPQRQLFERLERRFATSTDTTVLPYGVGAEPGQTSLWIPSYNGYRFDGLASTTSEQAAIDWFPYSIRGFDPSKVTVERAEIEVVRLDDIASEPVGFVKIDIQGAELAALEGSQRILGTDRPVLMIEQSEPGPIDRHLDALGYDPHAWRDGALHPGIGSLNTVYLPRP